MLFLNLSLIRSNILGSSESYVIIIPKAVGNLFKAPSTPDPAVLARIVASAVISFGVISSALTTVSLKFSSTRIPSPASSFKILSSSTSCAWGLKESINWVSSVV